MKIATTRFDRIRRRLLLAVLLAVVVSPMVFGYIKLLGMAFDFAVPHLTQVMQWVWIGAAYIVCFAACLHLGAESRSKGSTDALGIRIYRAMSFFAAMSAFGLCVSLCFGMAAVTNMSFAGGILAFPLVFLTFGGLILGDIYGCPRFLR